MQKLPALRNCVAKCSIRKALKYKWRWSAGRDSIRLHGLGLTKPHLGFYIPHCFSVYTGTGGRKGGMIRGVSARA